jgi:hypothetical protein
MWIGLFAVVLAIALGFGVAAFVMQPGRGPLMSFAA